MAAMRLASQLLAGPPARSAGAVVDRLLAVQAQDGRGFRLTVRSRTSGLTAADIDTALTTSRSLVVTWLNRGTLHLVAADDYWWLHELTTPQLARTSERRLRQEGVSPSQAEQGVALVVEAVKNRGPQTREQLRRHLQDAHVPTAGQALVHILIAASLQGHVVRGPVIGTDQAFVSVADWLGPPPPPLERQEALGRLARRYLGGHAPATAEDLAKWAGVTLGQARQAFETITDELVPAGDAGWRLGDTPEATEVPPPRLLGPFDPLLHGWVWREPFVGPHKDVVTMNGIFRPIALVDGRVVATWRLASGTLTLKPLERIPPGALGALNADAADVFRFLGLPDRPIVVS